MADFEMLRRSKVLSRPRSYVEFTGTAKAKEVLPGGELSGVKVNIVE